MVWPFGKRSTQSAEEETAIEGKDKTEHKIFLEDVPPKFDTDFQKTAPQHTTQSKEMKRILSNLSWADFHPSNLLAIPCFRDAGLAGFSCLFVFSSVMFLYHKDVRKAANWGFGGLMLGATFAWEQCNAQRRREQQAVQMAQERYRQRRARKTE
ncbi:hypothetical protein KL919_001645 [Ogataea angusta]|nr:hypothetical protein KL909_002587 [Ogataea angusta]KAG7829540.1 hypothetical protein KL920_002399 [Ogataea angusta]KAG7838403.1 hypothetical protein KL943_000479 [Ogataea angusta]KAG7846860.1 hypothetical protein KL941_002653 [Ogataea angusta]KAG7862515.1 hypothetical protein KL919_001645 [Ogataea angusta]